MPLHDLSLQLQVTHDVSKWIDHLIDGLELKKPETRFRLSAACLDIAMEHKKAIALLCTPPFHHYGSAFALCRPMLESLVRGIWLHRCATDRDVENYVGDKFDKSFGTIISDIESIEGYKDGIFSVIKDKSWDTLNSYTHGGGLHASQRLSDLYIETNYEKDELEKLLRFSDIVGLIAAMEAALIPEDLELAMKVLDKLKTLKYSPNNYESTL